MNNTPFNGKSRFKNIKKPFKNPEINQDDVNKKFDLYFVYLILFNIVKKFKNLI